MKATLEYDLSKPMEAKEAMRALKAMDLSIAIWDITQLLRTALKHEGFMRKDYLTEDEYEVVKKLEERINEIIDEHDIRFALDD